MKEQSFYLPTTLEAVARWAQAHSLWALPMGNSSASQEMISALSIDQDLSRVHGEWVGFNPNQCDLLMVGGVVNQVSANRIQKLYHQMPSPKWVIAVGSLASSGGAFKSYPGVMALSDVIPVDIMVPGNPPSPQLILKAIKILKNKIKTSSEKEVTQ